MDWSKFFDVKDREGVKTATALFFAFIAVFYLAAALGDTWKSLLEAVGFGFITSVSSHQIVVAVCLMMAALFRVLPLKLLEKGWTKLPEVREYQEQFPSRFLLDTYKVKIPGLTLDICAAAWFEWFSGRPKDLRDRTLTRGARCDGAFVLAYECLGLAVIGLLAVVIQFAAVQDVTRGLITVSGIYIFLFILFRFIMWRLAIRDYREINTLHKRWLAGQGRMVAERLRKLAGSTAPATPGQ